MSELTISANVAENTVIRIPCDAPAPIVANGCYFVGCQLERGHTEPVDDQGNVLHQVVLKWRG